MFVNYLFVCFLLFDHPPPPPLIISIQSLVDLTMICSNVGHDVRSVMCKYGVSLHSPAKTKHGGVKQQMLVKVYVAAAFSEHF